MITPTQQKFRGVNDQFHSIFWKKILQSKYNQFCFFSENSFRVMSYPRNFMWSFTIIKTKITHLFEVLYFIKMHIDMNLLRQKYTKDEKIQKICGRDYKIIYCLILTSKQLIWSNNRFFHMFSTTIEPSFFCCSFLTFEINSRHVNEK